MHVTVKHPHVAHQAGISVAMQNLDFSYGSTPALKDINLDIFEGTGYAGRAPGQVGVDAYTSADSSASLTASAATTIALALSMAVFLFV